MIPKSAYDRMWSVKDLQWRRTERQHMIVNDWSKELSIGIIDMNIEM